MTIPPLPPWTGAVDVPRGRTLQQPGTGSHRYSSSVRPASRGRSYLLGFDRARDDRRTLRLDRIADLHVTTFRFVRHDPPDAAAFVGRAVTSSPYRWQARVRVHAPVADVAARVPATVARLEADGDDRCLLTTGAHDLGQLVGHLAALPWDLEVLDPPELRDAVRAAGERLVRAAAAG